MSSYSKTSTLFRDWMKKKFSRSELRDIVNHGVSGGFSGLIYYNETTALYQKYHQDIWSLLIDDAETMGCKNPIEFIANYFSKVANVDDHKTFVNLLVWYAAERVAIQLIDANE